MSKVNAIKIKQPASKPNAPKPRAKASRRAPVSQLLSFPEALSRAPKPIGRREQILHAAVEVLNAEGFGALTQTRVAERAGVRQSHLTYYFPVRNDLLRETAVYSFDAMLASLSIGIESGELTVDNFREAMTVDIHDRRFARLMSALIVASEEDAQIKPWLGNFGAANVKHFQQNFHKLGLPVTLDEVAFLHATFVGAVMLDLGESTDDSLARAQRKVRMAFDTISAAALARNATKSAKAIKTKASTVAKGKKKS